jgi:hypothetical protein
MKYREIPGGLEEEKNQKIKSSFCVKIQTRWDK